MINAKGLTRLYGQKLAVHDLNFHVKCGEVMGLLGPNGAGKSTTLKMLSGFLPPSSGFASIAGVALEDDLSLRRQLGYLPEHAPLYVDLDVYQHLHFIGSLHGLNAATLHDKIIEMSAACGLHSVLYRRIDELSKGYRQRVGLAASMLHDPACLILDEPTTGLDPNQMIEIRHLIRRLGEHKTILLSSHVLSEVEVVCDRMMIMDAGKLQAMGSCEALIAQAQFGMSLHVRVQSLAEQVIDRVLKQYADCQVEINPDDDGQFVLRHADAQIALAAAVFQATVDADTVLLELRPEKTSLEDVFYRITTHKQGGSSQ